MTDIHATDSTADPTRQHAPAGFTREQVADALNQAADDILDAVDAGDEGLRDALNLMVNATVAYLVGEERTLRDVVDSSYEADLPTVLGWIG
jgi:hypothetical protein